MPISYSEQAELTCPACSTAFTAELWPLVDAAERPDLAQALRDGTLDQVTCPHCGHTGPAGAPLLLHDPEQRRVYFAVPPDVSEHIWRERAQELLYLLVGSLPEEARLPYLGDVQVEQEISGVQRAMLRRSRRQSSRAAAAANATPVAAPTPVSPPTPPTPPAAPAEPSTELLDAVQNLLAADTPTEFAALVERYPILLGDDADGLLRDSADQAYAQGEREVGEALRAVRASLLGMRAPGAAEAAGPVAVAAEPTAMPAALGDAAPVLGAAAYQTLLQAASADALQRAAVDHPVLLETWVDAALAARAEDVLSEGNERLAVDVEERREALAELRAAVSGARQLRTAIEQLLGATTEDALADVVAAHPILLTSTAQHALAVRADEARASGDADTAGYAAECQALLASLRAGLAQ